MYDIRIKWLSITCFEMQFGNTTVVSDPCIGANPYCDLTWKDIEHCDVITLSHCHWDHITDIPALMENYPVPLLTGSLSAMPMLRWLNCNPSRIYPMDANLELDFGDVKIRALFGKHCALRTQTIAELEAFFEKFEVCAADRAMLDMQVLGTLEYRNFLFTDRNGTKVLLWGNDVTTTQVNQARALRPDVCILQLTKQTPEEIANFAEQCGCKVLIPHHMDLEKTRDQYMPQVEHCKEAFLRRVPDGRFVTPENGRWIYL